MPQWMLQYDFHTITITMEEINVETKYECFENVEDMIKSYREKSSALLFGFMRYNDNFKIFRLTHEQVDINMINKLANISTKE